MARAEPVENLIPAPERLAQPQALALGMKRAVVAFLGHAPGNAPLREASKFRVDLLDGPFDLVE